MKEHRLSGQAGQGFGPTRGIGVDLKQALLLTTAIFLMTAPTPDSKDIASISASFIVPPGDPGSLASGTGE